MYLDDGGNVRLAFRLCKVQYVHRSYPATLLQENTKVGITLVSLCSILRSIATLNYTI